VLVLAFGFILVPGVSHGSLVTNAMAGRPTVPPIPEVGKPTSSPSPEPSPSTHEPTADKDAASSEENHTEQRVAGEPRRHGPPKAKAVSTKRHRARHKRGALFHRRLRAVLARYHPSGRYYDSSSVVDAATRLTAAGWSEKKTLEVYRPFILAGEAHWTDTWGAPRFGPRPRQVRSHEGQDVFCTRNEPVLAAEDGVIEFDVDRLGGKIARLHRADGSYWYYAHLSSWNSYRFASGDKVSVGDVIGYCGNSGDAREGPTQVHFGWYGPDGVARDPMDHLAVWLSRAEVRSARAVSRTPSAKALLLSTIAGPGDPSQSIPPTQDISVVSGVPLLGSQTPVLWLAVFYILAVCLFAVASSDRLRSATWFRSLLGMFDGGVRS
jgi:murein DD-endopeptidase MepM/ murein hydrolase activator NlpD